MKFYMLHTCIEYTNSYELFRDLKSVRQDIVDWVIDNQGEVEDDEGADDDSERGSSIGLDDVRQYFEDNPDETMSVIEIDTEKFYTSELEDKEVFADEHSG